ncbi:hypothetical protein [Streptomyces triticirhizae]|uniref:hypothetical protein n=1 Tax=Streptomyces triticirhizae TaxID=2483353 RepID=UPI000EFAC6A9|nr:hypothetical protein [Streptomyces triticirhizae]
MSVARDGRPTAPALFGDAEWEFQIPLPGRLGEEQWALGPCWFFCGHRVAPVVWIGCLTSEGGAAPLYACDTCLRQLNAMAWDFTDAARAAPLDGEGQPVPPYQPLGRARAPSPPHGRWHHPARTTFGTRFWHPETDVSDRATKDTTNG